jgi:hypothetical protein
MKSSRIRRKQLLLEVAVIVWVWAVAFAVAHAAVLVQRYRSPDPSRLTEPSAQPPLSPVHHPTETSTRAIVAR